MRNRLSHIAFSLSLLSLLVFVVPQQVHANSLLFLDDFVGNGFPSQWVAANSTSSYQNTIQNGGWLYFGINRNNVWPNNLNRIIANTTSPLLGANVPNGQVIYMKWNIIPFFNVSSISSSLNRQIALNFGLRNCLPQLNNACTTKAQSYIMWRLGYSDVPNTSSGEREWVTMSIDAPSTTVPSNKCYDSTFIFSSDANCFQAIRYTTPDKPIDLSQPHTFQIWGTFYVPARSTGNTNSWIAFSIDNNAWINMTQQNCGCIGGNTFYSMWPFMEEAFTGTWTQNTGALVDYVYIADYPAATPSGIGQFLPVPMTPSGSILPTDTLTIQLQKMAYSLGSGNVAWGGILETLMMMMLFVGLPAGAWFMATRTVIPPFISVMFSIMVIGMMMYVGVLSIWIAISWIALFAASFFGVLKVRMR